MKMFKQTLAAMILVAPFAYGMESAVQSVAKTAIVPAGLRAAMNTTINGTISGLKSGAMHAQACAAYTKNAVSTADASVASAITKAPAVLKSCGQAIAALTIWQKALGLIKAYPVVSSFAAATVFAGLAVFCAYKKWYAQPSENKKPANVQPVIVK